MKTSRFPSIRFSLAAQSASTHQSHVSYTFLRYDIPVHSSGPCEPLARRVPMRSQYGRPHSEGKSWYVW